MDTVDYLVKEEAGIREAGDEYQPHHGEKRVMFLMLS